MANSSIDAPLVVIQLVLIRFHPLQNHNKTSLIVVSWPELMENDWIEIGGVEWAKVLKVEFG